MAKIRSSSRAGMKRAKEYFKQKQPLNKQWHKSMAEGTEVTVPLIAALGNSAGFKRPLGDRTVSRDCSMQRQKQSHACQERLLFHRRLQNHSQKWNLRSLSDNRGGNTKGIGQHFNLFHLFSGGKFPHQAYNRAGITDGSRHGVVESTLSYQRCSALIDRTMLRNAEPSTPSQPCGPSGRRHGCCSQTHCRTCWGRKGKKKWLNWVEANI